MLIENPKLEKINNNKLLADLRGYPNTAEPRISSIKAAEIQYRISKELNDRHPSISNAIKNK